MLKLVRGGPLIFKKQAFINLGFCTIRKHALGHVITETRHMTSSILNYDSNFSDLESKGVQNE